MGTTLARAYVQIAPSAEGIKQQLTDILGKEVGGAGDEAGKTLGNSLVSKIKGVIAAAGIGSAIKSSLMEGANEFRFLDFTKSNMRSLKVKCLNNYYFFNY